MYGLPVISFDSEDEEVDGPIEVYGKVVNCFIEGIVVEIADGFTLIENEVVDCFIEGGENLSWKHHTKAYKECTKHVKNGYNLVKDNDIIPHNHTYKHLVVVGGRW